MRFCINARFTSVSWRSLGFRVWLVGSMVCGSGWAADAKWELVWNDDFNRETLGSNWYVRVPAAEIVDGQLHLRGHGVTVLAERGFAHDLRLEYEARQDVEVPPIDLSSTTGASRIFGWGHLHSWA